MDDRQRIIEKYKNTVFRVAYAYCKNRADAEDIFQEVFLQYFRKNPEFTDDNHEKAWFIRSTINRCKNLLHSAWWKNTVTLEENILFDTEEESGLFCAVMELPKKYRTVIHLYYYEEYSVREISEITSQKESTIQSQLRRGRQLLKEKLERSTEYEQGALSKSV